MESLDSCKVSLLDSQSGISVRYWSEVIYLDWIPTQPAGSGTCCGFKKKPTMEPVHSISYNVIQVQQCFTVFAQITFGRGVEPFLTSYSNKSHGSCEYSSCQCFWNKVQIKSSDAAKPDNEIIPRRLKVPGQLESTWLKHAGFLVLGGVYRDMNIQVLSVRV